MLKRGSEASTFQIALRFVCVLLALLLMIHVTTPRSFQVKLLKPGLIVSFPAPPRFNYTFTTRPWELAPAIDKERRSAPPVPLFLSYKATLGLCNQMFSHINALALGYFMNASVVLTETTARTAFGKQDLDWVAVPPNRTLDLQHMTSYWQERGLSYGTSSLAAERCALINRFIDIKGLPPHLTKHVKPIWSYTLPEAMDELTAVLKEHLDSVQQSGAPAPACVNIDIGNPIAMLNQERSVPFLKQGAHGVFMAPQVEEAAQKLAEKVGDISHTDYMGVHLRIEEDWHAFQFNITDMVPLYISAMKTAGFTSQTTIYVASGIFSAWEPDRIAAVEKRFRDAGVVGKVLHQRKLLTADYIQQFDLEQQALMDHLVLMRANRVVGDPYSSFSAFLRERRALHDIDKHRFLPIRETERGKMFFTTDPP